jgi:hypothetical protein
MPPSASITSISDILAVLRKIENICTTSHWTSDRRWAIELEARKLRMKLEKETASS